MRDLIVMATTAMLCLLSPIQPRLGLYGYYWFALMRPDILAWSGPNRYSLLIAVCTLLANMGAALTNMQVLLRSPLCRTLLLLLLVVSLSVPMAVKPELCYDPYFLFLRMIFMAFLIPLTIRKKNELEILLVVMAASIGLLAGKYGLSGLLSGGARYSQGFGGMLSDNNTMALAFVLAIPLCWFSGRLVTPLWGKLALSSLALLSAGGVIFTHSRGGALATGVALFIIAWRSKHRILLGILVLGFASVAIYLVRDSFLARVSTVTAPTEEASAYSRIVLAQSAVKMWLDYPILGVGFTEFNERELIAKYVPDEYRAEYSGKVIHNTYLQMLVDSGIIALFLYCLLLFGGIWKLEKSIRRMKAAGEPREIAIPLALQSALLAYAVGSTFLSRVSFDFFYILVMVAAAWLEIERDMSGGDLVQVVGGSVQALPPLAPAAAPAAPEPAVPPSDPAPWKARPQGDSRIRFGRERR